jgi:hypothetical protein
MKTMADEWRAKFFGADPRVYQTPHEADAERRRYEARVQDIAERERIERELMMKARELQRAAERLDLGRPMTEAELAYAAALAAREETDR